MNQAPATYFTYRENKVFDDIGMWDNTAVTVTGRGEPERVDALLVTDGTLPIVGVRPALGRTFTPADDAPGSAETVIVSHDYWRRALGGNAAAIGQSIVIDGRPREVIGVLPEGFRFLRYNPAVLLPLRFNRQEVFIGNFSFQAVARLKPGADHRRSQRQHRAPDPEHSRQLPAAARIQPADVRRHQAWPAGAAAGRRRGRRHRQRCCGFCSAPSASSCSWPARTSPTCSWSAPKAASRSSPSAPRSARADRR